MKLWIKRGIYLRLVQSGRCFPFWMWHIVSYIVYELFSQSHAFAYAFARATRYTSLGSPWKIEQPSYSSTNNNTT